MSKTVLAILKEILYAFIIFIYDLIVAIIKTILPASVQGNNINGETVLITGAGSGIGRCLAIRFAKLGCRLVLWDISEDGNKETAAQVEEAGATVKTYTIDLCDREAVYRVAAKVKKEFGDVDILVNNAGIVTGRKFLDCPDEMIKKTMDVNIMAHYWTVKAFLPEMIERNHGHIVTIASSAGFIGVTGLADYCASKYAAVGFDESMRFELYTMGKKGVHTTVVCPYLINTGMFEGVKSRFPFLLPILEQDYVADKIVDAVLCEQHILLLPRILYIVLAIKGILPTNCQFVIADLMGINHFMETFRGRQKKNE
ncbi:hypothetical protein CHS0354_011582 [Potamilus streckersoni]|uniref:Uncharacterized protein n=1 Tax=Potamilus streckersoni TaxID=2493646 RepID=A0AAE0RRJ8_9BIVA|nr:hypothetical protein CHS0354_011582 [Potamilus streckersoni]